MHLVGYSDYSIAPSAELMLVRPFRRLYEEDPSPAKEGFYSQLSYVYFMLDPRSPYMYLTDEGERRAEVLAQEGLPEDFRPSETLSECMEVYPKLCTTTASLMLEDLRGAADALRRELRGTDYAGMDAKEKIAAMKSVAATIAMIPKLIEDIAKTEKAVEQEIGEKGRVRGDGDLTVMDRGIKSFFRK